MDTITLLQIDAGCHLYECSYSAAPKAQRYAFKSFQPYNVGDYAFVLPSGVNERDHARVVRVEGPAEFSEEIERYRWLCGPVVLPDMQEGERIDTNARRKIALGGAIAAAKASAAGLTLEDYTPPAVAKSADDAS